MPAGTRLRCSGPGTGHPSLDVAGQWSSTRPMPVISPHLFPPPHLPGDSGAGMAGRPPLSLELRTVRLSALPTWPAQHLEERA